MDSCLILGFWLFDLSFWTNALSVAIGLGLVIFVHELGHFAVAKMCGVRCDKFYLGFDIGGWKLWKFTAGETEYGIGILPLGGYVKMLGQEDNPSRLKEEIQRAKAGQAPLDTPEGEETMPLSEDQIKELEDALYDPRSYLAQNVPKRMAIISAGVIMNLIFAFVAATVAYSWGVQQPVCGVGSLQPGGPAWAAGLKPGDMIREIGGEKTIQFRDLQPKIVFNDHDKQEYGIPFKVERPGESEPVLLHVHPSTTKEIRTIGIQSPSNTTIFASEEWISPIKALSAASKAEPPLKPGDTIVAIDGEKIGDNADLHRVFALKRDKALELTVERHVVAEKGTDGAKEPKTATVKVELPPEPLRGVGLVMEMGPIVAVQSGSTADKAGLKPGDFIKEIDGNEPGDPMTLEHRLRDQAGETITLTIDRDGQQMDIPVIVGPNDTWNASLLTFNDSPITVAELGIAIQVPPVVVGILPDSPAAKAGVQADQRIKSVTMLPPSKEELSKFLSEKEIKRLTLEENTMSFDTEDDQARISWPDVFGLIQNVWPGTKFKIAFDDGNEVTLSPAPLPGRFYPERGIMFEPILIDYRAQSIGEAVSLGYAETTRQMTLIFRFLRALFSGQVSPKALAGPGMIVKMASMRAEQGFSAFLLFLTLLSANLAVINFLPIPVLDGGHMVFLTYELIRRKPANEQIQIALSYLGLLFILTLMVWVIGLDLMRFLS